MDFEDAPVRVTSATGLWTSIATWLSAAGIMTLLGVIVRQAVPWKRAVSDEREADFARLRLDIDAARKEADEAKLEAKEATKQGQRHEAMLSAMRPALAILKAEVKRLDPDSANNAALRQVDELLALAATSDNGFSAGMNKIAATGRARPRRTRSKK